MTDHDAMALLDTGEPVEVDVWASLARHARWLADHAEQVAQLDPADRHRTVVDQNEHGMVDEEIDEEIDELAVLDERALAVRALVAACRRDTWQALRDRGWSVRQIADRWSVTDKAVYKVLSRRAHAG